ncbi:hypothetical protein [Nonomuraea deserti]|nr:hypothetical protein [Nonomuraea deserti]
MLEINFPTESDRACWELLARGKGTYFGVERSDDDYERTKSGGGVSRRQ